MDHLPAASVRIHVRGRRDLPFELTGQSSVSMGDTYSVDGFSVTPLPSGEIEKRSWPAVESLFYFVIAWAGGEALSAAARRIHRAVKGRATELRIDGRDVPVEEQAILDVLREAQGDR
jgi:hypothetical protein